MAYLGTLPGILKLTDLAIMSIVITLGCYGHFSSAAKNTWDDPQKVEEICFNNSNFTNENKVNCPHDAMSTEIKLVAISIAVFILTFAGLLLFWVLSPEDVHPAIKIGDSFWHIVFGVILLNVGVMMIKSTNRIENFELGILDEKTRESVDLQDYRRDYKFGEKIAAGAFAIISTGSYLVTAWVILKTG